VERRQLQYLGGECSEGVQARLLFRLLPIIVAFRSG
jgi:hypothetical protein